MNRPLPTAIDVAATAASYLEEALGVLALRLKHEVAVTRVLRGDTRQENFLGLFLAEEDAQAMLDEIAGRTAVEGGAETLDRIARLEAAQRRRRRAHPDLPWSRLAHAFRLTEAELDLILLAAAPAIDPRFGRVYGFLNDDMARRILTPALAQRLLAAHEIDLATLRTSLAPTRPLRRHGLVQIADTSPLMEAALTVPEPVIDLLLGADTPDPTLAALTDRFDGNGAITDENLVVLVGPDCGAAALDAAGPAAVVRLEAARVAHLDPSALRNTVRAFLRQAHLAGDLPYLAGFATAPQATRADLALLATAPCLLDAPRMGLWAQAGLAAPERAAPPLPPQAESTLFGPSPLAIATGIPLLDRLALRNRFATAPSNLEAAVRARAAQGMDGVAELVETTFGPADLVLAPAALRQLADFASWRRHAPRVLNEWRFAAAFRRRPGAVALFRGPSGTGKTMAASVVANAMSLPLFRVEIAGLVSKYIGETEKNLERLFAAAAASDVVLFFDEADALFGKRTEVADAHDRYANLETSYLLQRIEAQDGAVILATNLQDNIDPAFLRRIDMVVDFPAPTGPDRLRLWDRLRSTAAPLAADLDLPFLAAGFELTGGEIRNILVAAAHAAARDGVPIGMRELVRALAQEWQKSGRPLRRTQFGPYFVHLREPPP